MKNLGKPGWAESLFSSINDRFQSMLPIVSAVPEQRTIFRQPQSQVLGAQSTPTPTNTPTPTPTPFARFVTGGADMARNEISQKIRTAFSDDPETGVAVGIAESSLNPKARFTNHNFKLKSGKVIDIDAIGLFQINLPAHLDKVPGNTYEEKAQNLLDPEINLQVARKIYERQGWNPWEAYTAGHYKKHLQKP